MNDFILRYADEKDMQQILALWECSFGDAESFVRGLLEDCGLLENAVCAELEGLGRSFMFAFDGLRFKGASASYIYALCTEPAYRGRGLGRAVTLFAAEKAAERGAEAVFLCPAGAELEKWYASSVGAVPLARAAVKKIRPSGPVRMKAEAICPPEYLSRRDKELWQLPLSLCLAQDCVHRHCGGGFFRCGEALVCAEKRAEGVYVRELSGSDKAGALAAVAEKFAVDELYLLEEGENGCPLMFIPPYLPAHGVSFMPFTLD